MSASKTLIAALAAATIVGTVGFVSAQTTDPAAPTTGTQPMTNPSTVTPMPSTTPMPADRTSPGGMNSGATNSGSSTSPTMNNNTAPAADTLEPKADRN